MKNVFFKATSRGALYLRNHAINMTRALMRVGGKTRYQIVDGYIIKAQSTNAAGYASIIDTPGVLACFRTEAAGTTYAQPLPMGRATFDSREGFNDGPYVPATGANPSPSALFTQKPFVRELSWQLGFDEQSYKNYKQTRPQEKKHRVDGDRTYTGWLSHHAYTYFNVGPELFEYGQEIFQNPRSDWPAMYNYVYVESFANLRINSSVASGVAEDISTVDAGILQMSGFTISSKYVSQLLGADYGFVKKQYYPYSGWHYQQEAPSMVRVGDTFIIALPIVKEVGYDVMDWGEASVLFLCTRAVPPADGTPITLENLVLWHRVWEAKTMLPVPPARPQYCRSTDLVFKYYTAVIDRVDEIYAAGWVDGNLTSSTPNWTDCLHGGTETYQVGDETKERAFFRFRYTGLHNDAEWIPSGAGYWETSSVGGDAIIEVKLNEDGAWTYDMPYFDSCESLQGFNSDGEPTVAFAAMLPYINTAYRLRIPIVTMQTRAHNMVLVDLDLYEQNRVWATTRSSRLFAAGVRSTPNKCGMLIRTKHVSIVINFSTLGLGVPGLLGYRDSYGPPEDTQYKWPVLAGITSIAAPSHYQHRGFAMLSRDELGILMLPVWNATFGENVPGTFDNLPFTCPVSLVGFNVVTGQVRVISPDIGTAALSHRLHLCTLQERIVDGDGKVVVEGVHTITWPSQHDTARLVPELNAKVMISRDSGVTWSNYIMPLGTTPVAEAPLRDGIYLESVAYLGTQLIDAPPGAAAMKP